ncbi:MAG: carboxymuconolactone decarboxylase family protein [Solirubrobacterales bacterium]|nr:carboxymuconolactone decarboxylase family protein [Solirubrobacterales bacterium]
MKQDDSQNSTSERGRAIRARAQGKAAPALEELLAELDPALPGWTDEFIFGDVWSRPGLEHEQRMLVAIASLASLGHVAQLRNYLHGALQDGMDPDQIQETLIMTCVYAGFPTALTALHCWLEVKRSHERRPER